MQKLESKVVKGNLSGVVNVYDGDVRYSEGVAFNNKANYYDSNGKKQKTRTYAQWTAMKSRLSPAHQKNFDCYDGVTIDPRFLNFDYWMEWAEKQAGFMCVDSGDILTQQDKDIVGNKRHYSEYNCVFVPSYINGFFRDLNGTGRNYKSVVKTVERLLSEDFCDIDERVIDAIIDEVGFKYALPSCGKKTYEDVAELHEFYALCNSCINWQDDVNYLQSINFMSGGYRVSFNLEGKNESKVFKDVVEAIKYKLTRKLEFSEKYFSKYENSKYSELPIYEKVVSAVARVKKFNEVVCDDITKLSPPIQKYILVDY